MMLHPVFLPAGIRTMFTTRVFARLVLFLMVSGALAASETYSVYALPLPAGVTPSNNLSLSPQNISPDGKGVLFPPHDNSGRGLGPRGDPLYPWSFAGRPSPLIPAP